MPVEKAKQIKVENLYWKNIKAYVLYAFPISQDFLW